MPGNDHVFFWATVESGSPLTVRRDGETAPIGVAPSVLVDPAWLRVGDRVWCQLQYRRALVLGVAGGVRVVGEWQNLGVFGGWDASRAVWRYREGGIDVVFRGNHDGSTANMHRPFNIPGVTLHVTWRGGSFMSTSNDWRDGAIFTVDERGHGVFFRHEQRGGWLDVNIFVPDYFLN